MRVNGRWLAGEDGEVRPIVPGLVWRADDRWLEVSFLLDSGADRTVFSSRYLHHLRNLEMDSPRIILAGIGGAADFITVETSIGFVRHDGELVTVRGTFGVFTKGESADLSILGRDVTNNFSVIYDHPGQRIALLAPPHAYEIKSS